MTLRSFVLYSANSGPVPLPPFFSPVSENLLDVNSLYNSGFMRCSLYFRNMPGTAEWRKDCRMQERTWEPNRGPLKKEKRGGSSSSLGSKDGEHSSKEYLDQL